MDELSSSLSAYEMRTIFIEMSKREDAFDRTKKGKEEASHEEIMKTLILLFLTL